MNMSADKKINNLLLTSNGLEMFDIVNSAVNFLGDFKPETCVFINEGYVPSLEEGSRWTIEELIKWKVIFQCKIQFTNLSAQSKDVLRYIFSKNDFIFINGGCTDYVHKILEESKCYELFEEMPEKPIIGSSAGAMCFGKRISNNGAFYFYHDPVLDEVQKYYELYNFVLLPHFEQEDLPLLNKKDVLEFSKTDDNPIVCISNSQALIFKNGIFSTVGGDPFCVYKGKEISFKEASSF